MEGNYCHPKLPQLSYQLQDSLWDVRCPIKVQITSYHTGETFLESLYTGFKRDILEVMIKAWRERCGETCGIKAMVPNQSVQPLLANSNYCRQKAVVAERTDKDILRTCMRDRTFT